MPRGLPVPDDRTSDGDNGSNRDSATKRGAGAAGRSMHDAGQAMMAQSADRAASAADSILASMKRGGKVKRTGAYRLHKGERVVPAKRGKKRGRVRGRY